MKTCPQCGAENQPSAKFCGMCQASLVKPKGPAQMPPRYNKTAIYVAAGVAVLGLAAYWSITHESGNMGSVEPSNLSISDLDHKGDVAYQGKDYVESLKRYRQAADKGDTLAMNWVGWFYQNGLGTPKNEVEAVRWYQQAADKGFSPSQTNLGWCYQNGLGVKADMTQAIQWYQKATAQGNDSAEINMGYLYENGIGVVKDLSQAHDWYEKAAKTGNQEAKRDLDMLAAKQVNLNAIISNNALSSH